MKKVILFGACGEAALAIPAIEKEGKEVSFFVDNNATNRSQDSFLGRKVLSFQEYLKIKDGYELIITVLNPKYRKEIIKQLEDNGITDWRLFHKGDWKENYEKERIISYCQTVSMEDVILYHVCHEIEEIFYIDVGSNDPYIDSVTKALYDMRNAHGINIEPQQTLIDRTNAERRRDINICAACGAKPGEMKLWVQGGGSTLIEKYAQESRTEIKSVPVLTLKDICNQYIEKGQDITFLKIDVEGFERDVLEGADFKNYRPRIILLEATKPGTFEWCHEQWEDILLDNGYHFVYEYGINRYYVANECGDLDKRFIPFEKIMDRYFVRKAILDLN